VASEGDGHSSEPRPQNRAVCAIWPSPLLRSLRRTKPSLFILAVSQALESNKPGLDPWLGHALLNKFGQAICPL
jgi:hypothetical protein